MATILSKETRDNIDEFMDRAEKRTPIGYYMAALVIVAFLCMFVAIKSFGLVDEGSDTMMVLGDSLNIVSTFLFLIVSIYGLVRAKNLKIRSGIICFSISSLSFFIAELIWTLYYNLYLGVSNPFPSFADVFYVIGSLGLIAAIYFVTRSIRRRKTRFDYFIEFSSIVAAALILIVYSLFTDIFTTGESSPAILFTLVYPVLDIMCLVLLIKLLVVSFGKSVFEAQVILTVGAGVMCIADIYYSLSNYIDIYSPGSLSDTLFAISYLLLAISAYRYVELTRLDILVDRVSSLTPK